MVSIFIIITKVMLSKRSWKITLRFICNTLLNEIYITFIWEVTILNNKFFFENNDAFQTEIFLYPHF